MFVVNTSSGISFATAIMQYEWSKDTEQKYVILTHLLPRTAQREQETNFR